MAKPLAIAPPAPVGRRAPIRCGPKSACILLDRLTSVGPPGIVSRRPFSSRQEDAAVTLCSRLLWAVVIGLCSAHSLPAQEPAPFQGERGQPPVASAKSANQQMADTIAQQLRQGGNLRRFNIDIAFANGTAEVSGVVADQTQREEALRIIQGVPGVERVRDRLVLASSPPIQQVQAGSPPGKLQDPLPPKIDLGAPGAGAGAAGPIAEPMPIFSAP